jgi:hypothetical protein
MDKKQADLIIMYYEFKRYHEEEKFSIQRIADYFGVNFRTVRKYLQMTDEEFDTYLTTLGNRPFLMDPFKAFIQNYLNEYADTPAAVMHDKLKEHFPDFPGLDPKTVYNYVMKIRAEYNIRKVTRSERQYSAVADIAMGEQAQVDFGEKRLRTSKGGWQVVYFFTMLLCHSRYKFILFRDSPFTSQSAVEAHEKAFEFFQGIPKEIVYDQDAVFIHRENRGDYILTDVFDRYRASRPFKVFFCRPGDPESKGKVENVVKYVKQNFLYNRIFVDTNTLNQQAIGWLNRTGNMMMHNTTCKIPYSEWCNEQKYLHSWHPVFSPEKNNGYKVIKTNTIKYRGNTYSLPFGTYKNDESKVFITESDDQLIIKDSEQNIIATHLIPAGKGQTIINNNHRRNTSVKLNDLRNQVREFFSYSTDIDTFISGLERHYPRYVRDQLSTLMVSCEKHGKLQSEVTLEFCVNNKIISANDFKTIIESQPGEKKRSDNHQPKIKPLGGSKTQLIAHMEPDKSDINEYELIFMQSQQSHEPVYTPN